jgi:hypothetical protein
MLARINRIIGRRFNSLTATVVRPTADNTDAFFAELLRITRVAGNITHAFCENDQPVGYIQLHRAKGSITIHRIWTVYPRRGIGSHMLRKVCELADKHQVFVKLKVAPLGPRPHPMSADQLRQWYHRHGFRGRKKMLRVPTSSDRLANSKG